MGSRSRGGVFVRPILIPTYAYIGIHIVRYDMKNENDELLLGGELIISGSDTVVIPLAAAYPKVVQVRFTDDLPIVPPCNPVDVDTLEYEVHHNKHKNTFDLHISWSISTSVREVRWDVEY